MEVLFMLNYKDLKENFVYPEVKEVDFNNQVLFIKQFLPSEDKYGIVYLNLITLDVYSKAYNPMIAEIIFDLSIIKEYTNITFEDDSEDSFFKQYDILQTLGIIDLVVENIPKDEYEELQRLYYESIEAMVKHSNSINNLMSSILSTPDLKQNLDTMDESQLHRAKELIEGLSEGKHI